MTNHTQNLRYLVNKEKLAFMTTAKPTLYGLC